MDASKLLEIEEGLATLEIDLGLAPGALLVAVTDGGFLLRHPAKVSGGWLPVHEILGRMATAEDAGRSELLSLWPQCERRVQDMILSLVGVISGMLPGLGS